MVHGTVKWYDLEKGFGFLAPDGGGKDVFVHNSSIHPSSTPLHENQRVEFRVIPGPRGPEAMDASVVTQEPSVHGTVKWYDLEKGFGFLAPDGGGEDVFVHNSNIHPSSTPLHENQRVEFGVVPGPEGPMAMDARVVTHGTVKWYDLEKGFGFLTPDGGGEDVFVHDDTIHPSSTPLYENQRVEFRVVPGPRGPLAMDARVVTRNRVAWFSAENGSGAQDGASTNTKASAPVLARYEGRDCALTVYEDSILIDHKSMTTSYVPVLLSRLSDVHFEGATRWTSGIITIAVDGNPLHVPTGTSVGGDPNTIVFKSKSHDTFLGVHAWLKQVIAGNRA